MTYTDKQLANFWRRVDRSDPNGCWPWTGAIAKNGYAALTLNNQSVYGHQLAYTQTHGPVPAGLHLDHTCHDPDRCVRGAACEHRRCCNPDHTEPVTQRENLRRGTRTRCAQGHPLTPGQRCHPCNLAWQRDRRHARSSATV